jgi:hypothetical protein
MSFPVHHSQSAFWHCTTGAVERFVNPLRICLPLQLTLNSIKSPLLQWCLIFNLFWCNQKIEYILCSKATEKNKTVMRWQYKILAQTSKCPRDMVWLFGQNERPCHRNSVSQHWVKYPSIQSINRLTQAYLIEERCFCQVYIEYLCIFWVFKACILVYGCLIEH